MFNMRILFTILGALLLAGCGTANGGGGNPLSSTPALESAYTACEDEVWMNAGSADDVSLDDDGHSVVFDGADPAEESFEFLACLLGELDTSDAVVAQMDSTTALMGRQTAEDGDYAYAWSYHPDNGVDMTITD